MTEKHKKEDTKEAPVSLDEKGKALLSLIPQALQQFHPQVSAAVDEVVVTVSPENLVAAARVCKEDPRLAFNYFRCLSVVDYEKHLEIVYHIFSLDKRHKMVIKTTVPEDKPQLPTITTVWPAANWFEREGHDLYGVEFLGHPDLSPLLLYAGFEGFPGRRSYPFHDYNEW